MSTAVIENGQETATALQPQSQTPFQKTKGWIQSKDFHEAIARALPKHMTAERYLRIATTALAKVPKLCQCTQESILNCLLQLSQCGLEPDGRSAHLIPFDVKRNGKVIRTDCTLIIDFKGYAELVMRSGLVSSIHADIICENDEFEYDRGFITKHKIDFRRPRGEAYAAYAVVRFKDGTEKCEVMPKEDILAIRDRSQGWKAFKAGYTHQSPWNPEEPVIEREMWKKTAFRRITKWVPLSPEIRQALSEEDDHEDRIRLIHANEMATPAMPIEPKVNRLVASMQSQIEDDDDQPLVDESPAGTVAQEEESHEQHPVDPPKTTEQEIAGKIAKAIGAATDGDTLMALEGEAGLIADESTRLGLYEAIKARRLALKKAKKPGEPNKGEDAGSVA